MLDDIDLLEYSNIEEIITTLTFRNSAFVTILKTVRERAFTQSVDIIITSIDYNLFEDSKTDPPLQFYGYATLVFQDCLSLEVPVRYPRQRIYYDRQFEALRQWRHWIEFYQLYQFHRRNDVSLSSVLAALQAPYAEFTAELRENAWIELPLRQVLFKATKNTQFEIEFTRWQAIPFIDPIIGVLIDGKSNQLDGSKDDGLPPDGIQPKRNDPSSPFSQNPPPSSIQEAGQKGFGIDNDASSLSDVTPDDGQFPDDFGYFAKIIAEGRYPESQYACGLVRFTIYFLVPTGSTALSVVDTGGQNNVCNNILKFFNVDAVPSGNRIVTGAVGASVTGSIIRAASMPATTTEFL